MTRLIKFCETSVWVMFCVFVASLLTALTVGCWVLVVKLLGPL